MLKEGLSSIIFDNEITVYWNRIASLGENDFYAIYLDGELLEKTKKTHIEIFDLAPETSYTVKVDMEKDEEWKIEMLCSDDCIQSAIDALKANHPYEEPIYQYWEVKA